MRRTVVAVLVAVLTGAGDPYYPLDGNGGYDATHYEVALGYDPPSGTLDGTTTVDAVATQPLRLFHLDFAGPPVRMVTVNGLPAAFRIEGEHELVVSPLLPLLPGLPFRVVVDYGGVMPDTRGEGWTYAPSGGAFAAGEPHSASTWYPLNDTPADRATFTLRATVPAEWQVVGNGVRTRDEVVGAHRHVDWESRQPTLGYLTTVAVDRFEFLEQRRANGTPIISAFAPGAVQHRELEQRLPEILDFAEALFGPYPFDAAGGIYLDSDLPFSLETQSRPIYAVWVDLNTVVHEIAHQWWGDSVAVRSWADICLNECFASYTADYLWPERMEGADVDAEYRDTVARFRAEPRFWQIPLQDPGAGREFTSVYYRGPLFLHALRRTVGDDVFLPALRDFLAAHAGRNAGMADWRAFVQARTPIPLDGFYDAWLTATEPPPDEYLFPGTLRG